MGYLIQTLLFTVILLFFYTRRKPRLPLGFKDAPGPPPLPLLGNAHQLSSPAHRSIISFSHQYGEIFKLRLGWNDWYMLCSPSAVKEILDKQSAHTSSRAPLPVASKALSGGMRFLFMEYGREWRTLRGLGHRLLTPKGSGEFAGGQEWEGRALVSEVLGECVEGGVGDIREEERKRGTDRAYKAVRRYTVSVIMTSTYGKRIPEWECDEVREIYGIMEDFSKVAAPGAYIADTLVPLGRLPTWMQWWQKPLKPLFDRQARLWMKLFTELSAKMETGNAPECFVKQVIEQEYEKQGISVLQAAFLAGSLIEAGSETTSAAINTALLYLLANPRIQNRAHEEISRVVGPFRSPTFANEPHLPYIRAIVKETMRIRPVTNIGTPHYTTAPVTYKNIHIPANSVVCIQQYAIHYDPELFPEPEEFRPERYLAYPEKSGVYAAGDAKERDHWNFGAGRRICSGLHLAENSMFIVLAKLIWGFELKPPLDESGKEEDVDTSDEAFMPGGNTVPKPFRCKWVVRGEEVRKTIWREWEDARREGYLLRGERVGVEGVVV
ncbi:cytochrome P450 [Delitschia confertaspora ATCC 74209]|uniref:Cytochrome P450 n=1 Tax=Delitschia confertaspora ATCC 74209 TaxID=1513339 RepID=A0A9P4MRH6_9PLEO|nr:cytochrome P450 [Delitschia confertaspora ATCC 74209]